MTTNNGIKSANLHVTGVCNYRCEHCFSRKLSNRCITPMEWEPILDYLKEIGVTKINFAGGEPVLYPHLKELAAMAKTKGFVTSIVSNGSLIDEKWLDQMEGLIDWIGLSVDSPDEEDEIVIGRHYYGVKHIENVVKIAELAHERGYKVKLNITIVRKSWFKDYHGLIDAMKPERIKAFRALTLENANDDIPDVWSITREEFDEFRQSHKDVKNMVFEDDSDMVNTYLMFEPLGRLMLNDCKCRGYLPFDTLKNEGIEKYLDVDRYYARDAVYEW